MKKSFCIIFTMAFLIQMGEPNQLKAESYPNLDVVQEETALEVLFNRVLIYCKDGSRLSGLLVGIEGDSLIMRVGTTDERIQRNDLEKIIIQKNKKKGPYAISGMISAIYATNMAFLRAENQPTFFTDDIGSYWGYLFGNTLYAALGGTLGILVSSILEKGEKVFEFTGNMERRNREWERLQRFIIGDNDLSKKVHFKIQAGKIFTRVSDRYRNLLKDQDYGIRESGWMDGESWEGASDINLLRKVQLTYSLNAFLDVGIASTWLGEPSFQGNKWEDYESSYTWQKLSATGVYGVGVFKPLHKVMPKSISWECGIGVGAAKVNFNLEARSITWNPSSEITDEYILSKTLLSGIAFTELSLYLYDDISLGLTADYAYIHEQQAPAMPVAGLPAQKLRFGNSSIGLSFGFHF